jgi:hypothetical protein
MQLAFFHLSVGFLRPIATIDISWEYGTNFSAWVEKGEGTVEIIYSTIARQR